MSQFRRFLRLALLLSIVISSSMLSRIHAQDTKFEAADCLVDIPTDVEAECGYLVVPENRANPTSINIRLYVVILKSANPVDDPVLYLDGGPGGSGSLSVESWLNHPIMETRDMILLDQRGTGYSEPTLNCPELEDDQTDHVEALNACRARLVNEGIDLSAYNSAESAADIADLREALNIESWNILGISYGTRLALTVLRDHPDGVRSVILDGVYPPQVNSVEEVGPNQIAAFETLFQGCANYEPCNAAYPDLGNTFYQLVANLDANPITLNDSPLSGNDFSEKIFQAMYDSAQIPELPKVIAEAADGNFDALNALTGEDEVYHPNYQDDTDSIGDSEGVYNSVECGEEIAFNDQDKAIQLLQDAPPELKDSLIESVRSSFEDCRLWDVKKADIRETEAVSSDIPVLLMNGTYDPITPPAWGALAAQTLSNSFNVDFVGLGHGSSVSQDQCADDVVVAFLDDPTAELDSNCTADMPGPDFVTN
jgi:pimeloyl-ACP methyl ester carboxylesterase